MDEEAGKVPSGILIARHDVCGHNLHTSPWLILMSVVLLFFYEGKVEAIHPGYKVFVVVVIKFCVS